jgi:chemotaxis protein methyltransferase WspC
MNQLGLDDIAGYEHWLQESESEIQSLIEEVVVSESWFFRDERPYEFFRDYVRTHWLHDLSRPPLRVLSLPCAGGEEPYSIAITLRDMGLPAGRFRIDAVDVSIQKLTIARRGIYSSNAFRGADLSFRTRYFHEHPTGFELDSSIRSTVRFFQASVLDPRLLEGSAPYDVVFCRNLLIYLEASARISVLATLKRLLAIEGLLFIGHADRLEISDVEPNFTVEGNPACFAYRLREQPAAIKGRSLRERELLQPSPALTDSASTFPVSASLAYTTISATDSVVAAPEVSSVSTEPSLLDQAAELANHGRFDAAIATCERHLRLKGYSSAVYYLMGMIYQAASDRERAEPCFHKAVYLDPMHDEALLALALLAERRGDREAAVSFQQRAERSMTMSTKREK